MVDRRSDKGVAVYFTEQEWALLNVREKVLYKDVMQENFEHVMSLGEHENSCLLHQRF
uniref:KRAB domain-containing protein n=1 Tax=Laticauda laticaudata TaxID=8630 RepID=A0A8C5SU73_LATLA